MNFSDVIATIALLVSLGAAGMTFWFYRRQLALIDTQERLNRRLIEKSDADDIAARRADVGAKLIGVGDNKYRVRVFNRGKASARNITIEFPYGNDLIPDHEIREKIPMEMLDQDAYFDLLAAIFVSSPRKQDVLLRWADDYSDNNEKKCILTL
ncbi:hypothetical protein HW532_12680 [Kaustia mangrovi]|uniref:Uncharacterized protein n=1 Tax=Kaustia mangrovi TaxID=2593653 RepID=A0A7S8C507_9HYPH|nr:hypothetical protein [Kaustia mangrovi]QPC43473.1 hypothetical protein HW532_12680 [Kaustia mangrovi]